MTDVQIIRFSHSQIDKFKNCPWSWKRIYQDKNVQSTESEATLWGTTVHEAVENFLLHGTPLPNNVQQAYGAQFATYLPWWGAKPGLEIEPHYGIDIDGNHIDPEHPYCWAHGYIDVMARDRWQAWIGDWKTGKSKFKSTQLQLYSAFVFAAYPEVTHINTGYFRLQHNMVDNATYVRDQAEALLRPYAALYTHLTSAIANNYFPKRAGVLCGWCDVRDCENNTVAERLKREARY